VAELSPPPEWGRLADLQRSLRCLDSGGGPSAVEESAGRGVRLRLARLAVEEIIRREGAEQARRRREELDRALDGFVERAASRAKATPPRLALPAPAVPSLPPAPARAPAPAPVQRSGGARPVKPRRAASRRAAPRRPLLPRAPLPECWSPRPVLGFRLWEMRGRLQGAWQAWDHPFREARCVSGRRESDDGEVPHTDGRCGHPPCGIYAFKEPVDLLAAFDLPGRSRRLVYGLVELSGKVVEHERGYRGGRAAVVAAAVLGRGRLVRVEGSARLQALFADPEKAVAALAATDPSVVEEVTDPGQAIGALVAYLTLARDFYELTAT